MGRMLLGWREVLGRRVLLEKYDSWRMKVILHHH
jgi:hypothetical protein